MTSTDPLEQLEAKLLPELNSGHQYEALQYIQSYVARKKKSVGQNMTSQMVYRGAKLLILNGASLEAGTLLVWFIENGAGVDYLFNMEKGDVTADNYCDIQRLQQLIDEVTVDQGAQFVEKVYGPLHILAAKKNVDVSSPLGQRLLKLEETFANVFEGSKRWNNAYKSVARLGDSVRMANILDMWSNDGYRTEQPLFFARAVFQLLADKKVDLAAELVTKSSNFIHDNIGDADSDRNMSSSLAVWHLAVILSELASLPPMARVDKTKLFGLLMKLYVPILTDVDVKLVEILDKAGSNVFQFVSAAPQPLAANPMQFIKSMFSGATAAQNNSKPGIDLNAMMAMLNQMQK